MGRVVFLAAWVLMAVGCHPVREYKFISVEPEVWRAELDGEIRLSEGAIIGTDIDVGDLLNLDQREDSVTLRGGFRLFDVIIEGKYFNATYDGNTTLSQDISVLGQTFMLNADVASELDLTLANVHAKFGFGGPPLVIGAILGADYIDVDAKVESTNPVAISVSERIELPFPVAGFLVAATIPLDTWDVEESWISIFADAEITGLLGEYEEIDGKYIDASARAGLRIAKWFMVGGGYRHLEGDFDDGGNKAEVELGGPFVFGAISW